MTMLHIDLGTGMGGWTAPFKDSEDWRSVGLDIRSDLSADVVGDIRSLPFDCQPTLLTMSPPCTQFARWMLPWLDEPNPSTELIEACHDAVEELDPDYWVLENSRGYKQYSGNVEAKRAGPFYLWGEFPPFDVEISKTPKTQISGNDPEKRAKIPYELADALRLSIEWTPATVKQ